MDKSLVKEEEPEEKDMFGNKVKHGINAKQFWEQTNRFIRYFHLTAGNPGGKAEEDNGYAKAVCTIAEYYAEK